MNAVEDLGVDAGAGMGAILVTGATGFVGSRVAARLADRGWRVRGLVRSASAIPGVQTVVGDMLDHASLKEAVRGVDVVVHCAVDESGDVDRGRAVNVEGTRVLAEAALAVGCRRFVHISTCGAYALEGLDVVTEDTPLWPEDRIEELTYGVTKALGEHALASVAAQGLDAVILRPPNVLGAHPRSVFCEELATRVRDGTIGYVGDGDTTWPYVHVDNLVDAIEVAIDHPVAAGRSYTVVDGHTTWRAFLEEYADWFGVTIAPRDRLSLYDDFRGRFSTDRIRSELGHAPRRTYRDAMEETRHFLEEQGILPARRG
jgi:nucleoside-diphosphate-sugar epimerase